MLDYALRIQLATYLAMLQYPIRLTASLNENTASSRMRELLLEISSLSAKVTVDSSGTDIRVPSFVISRQDETVGVRFAAIPTGQLFTSLVLALLWTGGHPPKVSDSVITQIRNLNDRHHFEVYASFSCPNGPDVVQAVTLMSVKNPKISAVIIDGALFEEEVTRRQIAVVPTTYRNNTFFDSGRMGIEEILANLAQVIK